MNILAFFAHPDDETMLCGATLALAARKANLHILCATRGEGGETGEPPLCSREELGALRSAELSCAVKVLGASQEAGRPVTVPETIMTMESIHRVSPPVLPGQPVSDPFVSLLRLSGWARENPDLLLPGSPPLANPSTADTHGAH